jgi:hypothetical protein
MDIGRSYGHSNHQLAVLFGAMGAADVFANASDINRGAAATSQSAVGQLRRQFHALATTGTPLPKIGVT